MSVVFALFLLNEEELGIYNTTSRGHIHKVPLGKT